MGPMEEMGICPVLELLLGARAQHRGDVLSQDRWPVQAGGSHEPVVPDHDVVREVHLKDGGVRLPKEDMGRETSRLRGVDQPSRRIDQALTAKSCLKLLTGASAHYDCRYPPAGSQIPVPVRLLWNGETSMADGPHQRECSSG